MVLRIGIDSPVRAAWFTMASPSSTMPSSGIGSMDDIQDLFKETIAEFMENVRARQLYDTGVTAEYGDQLLTLSTCEYTYPNGRFVVVAKKA